METKMLMIAIVCAAAAGLAALGQAVKAEAAVAAEPAKILIAYYSYSGNTKAVAEQIQKATGGEIFEIKPAKAYPASYNECVDQAKKECGEGFKPQLAGALPDVSNTTWSSSAPRTGGARWRRPSSASSPPVILPARPSSRS
ncbi:MAG: flavodoxin [Cloacibacillus evryensis]